MVMQNGDAKWGCIAKGCQGLGVNKIYLVKSYDGLVKINGFSDVTKVTTGNMNENDIYDCSPVEVGSNVILFCLEIPKEIVAEGVLLSMDPNEKIDEIALGHEFVKVVIRKAIQPAYFLMRPRRGVSTVREAVGKSVAWEYVNIHFHQQYLFSILLGHEEVKWIVEISPPLL
ncbi:hypothetical protein BUALT_Bualt17G0010800 [Buddleja alternifolia]|uniref:Transposase Tnp1/En/Spm-like domain-containing protein n=1 Tax=Buddleja alternifolia TaxID=168488 RepID=A0AAV6WBK0_9LAMI|nr:hypothetical protein BUALT_Bualt17G0010800 [Buddleja alternifolia]